MSTANHLNTTTPKRRKRLLVSRKKDDVSSEQIIPSTDAPAKKRKRKLNIPTTNKSPSLPLSPSNSTPSTLEERPIPSPPSGTSKRSIRAASKAITKREKQRQEQEVKSPSPKSSLPSTDKLQPTAKPRRKLKAQKVIVPTSPSQTFEDTCDDSYDKYLQTSSQSAVDIPTEKPTIIIGVPTKKRRLLRARPIATNSPASLSISSPGSASEKGKEKEEMEDVAMEEDMAVDSSSALEVAPLDLSQHSILPNASYIAHLPTGHRRESTADVSQSPSSSSYSQSVSSYEDPGVMYTMDSYADEDSPATFYDAISDFEDLDITNIQTNDIEDDLQIATEQTIVEIAEEKSTAEVERGFWGGIFKSFGRH